MCIRDRRLAALQARLAATRPRLQAALPRRLRHDRARLQALVRALSAVSPLATVARGYAILQHDNGRVVRGVDDARPGDALRARVADGELRVRVEPDANAD